MCDFTAVPDGTACGDDAGTCQEGSCQVACSERGIRDAIVAGGGPYTFDCADGTTMVTQATIEIDNDVILDGAGRLTVDGGGAHLVLSVAEGVDAELRGFTVTNGDGGIRNMGTLTVTRCTVSGNYRLGVGGGLYNAGTMMLVGTTVAENTAEDEGGGIFNSYGTLVVTNSTVSGNKVNFPEDPTWWEDVTLVNLRGMMTLVNSTVSGTIYAEGGPGENVVAVVTSVGTVVRGECFGTPQDFGPNEWVSDGYNIEVGGDTCGFDATGDQINVSTDDLKLGELADNGGPTMTHALGEDSVAIDVIPAEDCLDADGEPLTTDQRGEPRDSMCDVGAFEVQFIATCFQDDECGPLICCHLGSPFEPGTCETQAVCDELQGGG
jgi:hypothetical protein